MDVVFSILQVFGWILLILLLILLTAVGLLLFCPIGYELECDSKDKLWAKAKVYWLFHLIRARVVYEDDLVFVEICIFWIRKTLSFESKKQKEDLEEEAEETIENTEETIENAEETIENAEETIENAEETIENAEEIIENAEETMGNTKETTENAEEVLEEAAEEASEEETGSKESIISKIKGIINRIKEIYPKLKKIITDDQNKQAVKHIKNELFYLVKILLPKESKADAVFSTGSPDTTGQAFGVLACFPIMYQEDWKIFPDFTAESAYFKGYLWGKGKFYGVQLVGIVLRILFDKNCQRMYTMINKFIKWVKRKTSQEDK